MKRRFLSGRGWAVSRVLLCAGAVAWAGGGCEEFDTTRPPQAQATFGDDLYGVLCDRLGADVLQEDLRGLSYQGVCHYDENGQYADEVDTSYLPPTASAEAEEARRVAIAKMDAMVRRRADLVRAFNATFPDVDIDNPATVEDEADKVNLLVAMMDLSQKLAILYDENPYAAPVPGQQSTGLAPLATRGLGEVFESIGISTDAKGMLERMWARRGYRPSNVGLGAMGATLAYPGLRDFTTSAVGLLGPHGAANPELKQLLAVTKNKMAFMQPEQSTLPPLAYQNGTLNRPRTTIELMRDLMLVEDDRFAPSSSAPARYIALRDRRGYVVPASLAGNFVDGDGDGLADVDGYGRFIDGQGQAAALDTPFLIPGQPVLGSFDEFGRSTSVDYVYVDTTRTPAASLSQVLTPLVDATEYADPADPNAFESEYETLMYALAGATVLLGPREQAEYDFEKGQVVPLGTDCASCMEYSRFRGEDSPLADLAYVAGQLFGDKDSDVLLLGLIDLVENHEAELARVLAAALRIKEISDEHDVLAAQGMIVPASVPYENPIWDQVAQAISRIANEPRLITNLLGALANPVVVTPRDGSAHLGETLALFASTVDEMSYNQYDISGPALNLSDGGTSTADPHHPVNVNAPRSGANRSILERSVQLIADASRAHTCNKDGAVVNAQLFGISVEWPLSGEYGPCELFQIDDLAAFYFGAFVPADHPKRSEFKLKDNTLNDIMDFFGFAADPDEMFEESSGIQGMTTHPGPPAMNRLCFFGATSDAYPNMPDHDYVNEDTDTNEFISGLMEPISTAVCGNNILCQTQSDTLRVRDKNTIFTWERRGFVPYMAPVVTAFVNVSCSADATICDTEDYRGERMLLDIFEAIWKHYPGQEHGAECSTTVDKDDRRYCSGAGINRYEPILEKALRTDVIPALHEFAVAVHDLSQVTIQRGPRAGETISGAEILEMTTKILFSQDYSASVGLKDRKGVKTAKWVDGTIQSQTTPFNIATDALHQMDVAFDSVEDGANRKAQWKRARSQLVDVLLATEGTGADTRFKIRGIGPLLSQVLRLTRDQVNAHCPNRESGGGCAWAKEELPKNVVDLLSSPFAAALVDLGEKMRQDNAGRRSLERYLTYLLENAGEGVALQATLASMVDAMQVMLDDEKLVPLMRAMSVALEPEYGAADTTLSILKAMSGEDFDRYHVLDQVLRNLVTPMPGEGGAPGLSPLELFMEVITEVHRADPTDPYAPLGAGDYGYIMDVMRDFMLSETRGLEQIYTIVRKRKKL